MLAVESIILELDWNKLYSHQHLLPSCIRKHHECFWSLCYCVRPSTQTFCAMIDQPYSQAGLIIFTIGSALSTAAQSMPMLLVGRGISGVGAAALLTVRELLFISHSQKMIYCPTSGYASHFFRCSACSNKCCTNSYGVSTVRHWLFCWFVSLLPLRVISLTYLSKDPSLAPPCPLFHSAGSSVSTCPSLQQA